MKRRRSFADELTERPASGCNESITGFAQLMKSANSPVPASTANQAHILM